LSLNADPAYLHLPDPDNGASLTVRQNGVQVDLHQVVANDRERIYTPLLFHSAMLYAVTPGPHTLVVALKARNMVELLEPDREAVLESADLLVFWIEQLLYANPTLLVSRSAYYEDGRLMILKVEWDAFMADYHNPANKASMLRLIERRRSEGLALCPFEDAGTYVPTPHVSGFGKAGGSPVGEVLLPKSWLVAFLKARAIVNAGELYTLAHGPWIKAVTELLYLLMDQWVPVAGLYYVHSGSSYTAEQLTEWPELARDHMVDNRVPWAILVAGDDSLIIRMEMFSSGPLFTYYCTDYSMYDASQRETMGMAGDRILAALGLPKEVVDDIRYMETRPLLKKTINRDRSVIIRCLTAPEAQDLPFQVPGESGRRRATGGSNTTLSNGIGNIIATITSIENTGGPTEEGFAISGLRVKIEVSSHDFGDATFLKGRWWLCEDGRRRWGWLPAAFLKATKLLSPVKHYPRTAYSLAKGICSGVTNIPILGVWVDKLLELGEVNSRSERWTYRPPMPALSVDRMDALRWVEQTYGLTAPEVVLIEQNIGMIPSLPWIYCDPLLVKLRAEF
jgi:hypothetical protein